MNVLDENIRDDQRALLRQWRIPFRQIGRDLARQCVQDEDLIPVRRRLKRRTFFSHDEDCFRREPCHRAYGLVWLDAEHTTAAQYVRAFLRPPNFRTQAQRMGKVVRLHPGGSSPTRW